MKSSCMLSITFADGCKSFYKQELREENGNNYYGRVYQLWSL